MAQLITGNGGYAATIGGTVRISGSNDVDVIYLADIAGKVSFDGSFNRGGDFIVLPNAAKTYTVLKASSSSITLADSDSQMTIPVGSKGTAIQFADGELVLKFDGQIMLGAQAVTATAAAITASLGVKTALPAATNASGTLIMMPDEPVLIGGNARVLGTNGSDTVTVANVAGSVSFDGSFNRGGDNILLAGTSNAYSVQMLGSSSSVISRNDTKLTVPLGTRSSNIVFADGSISLRYDTASKQALLGSTTLTASTQTVKNPLGTRVEAAERARFETLGEDTGIAHATGRVPFDLNRDGFTDLLLMPSLFNRAPELPIKQILYEPIRQAFSVTTLETKTGFVKDWVFVDVQGDKFLEIVLVDHGLELSDAQGGFQLGKPLIVSSNDDGSAAITTVALPRAFYHSLAAGDFNADGHTETIYQSFGDVYDRMAGHLNFAFDKLNLPSSNGAPPAGAIGTIQYNGGDALILASYVQRDPSSAKSEINIFDLTQETPRLIQSIAYPESWSTPNPYGAYLVITGDFTNAGKQDFIVLGESLNPNTKSKAVYLASGETGFSYSERFYVDGQTEFLWPSKMVAFDVDNDGFLDLLPFTWDGQAFSENRAILLNDGTGHFYRADTRFLLPEGGLYTPFLSTNANGSWKELIGFWRTNQVGGGDVNIELLKFSTRLSTGPSFSDTASVGAAGFNEVFYLAKNPDALAAVIAGLHSSGLAHYLATGRAEGREAFAPNAWVQGSAQNDVIVLREGNERGYGLDGDDSIDGKAGNDRLYGGAGNDVLTGGSGNDVIIFDTALSKAGVDRITDFNAVEDKIELAASIFKGLAGTLSSGQFLAEAGAAQAKTSDQRLIYDTHSGKLFYDEDGIGAAFSAVQIAVLDGAPTLSSSSFVFG